MKPLFHHDCPHCTFLGNVRVPMQNFVFADMYKCDKAYILRFSDDPADNRSGNYETLGFWFRTEQEVFNQPTNEGVSA